MSNFYAVSLPAVAPKIAEKPSLNKPRRLSSRLTTMLGCHSQQPPGLYIVFCVTMPRLEVTRHGITIFSGKYCPLRLGSDRDGMVKAARILGRGGQEVRI